MEPRVLAQEGVAEEANDLLLPPGRQQILYHLRDRVRLLLPIEDFEEIGVAH